MRQKLLISVRERNDKLKYKYWLLFLLLLLLLWRIAHSFTEKKTISLITELEASIFRTQTHICTRKYTLGHNAFATNTKFEAIE